MEIEDKSVSNASAIVKKSPTWDRIAVFVVQVSAILIIITFCLINLTINRDQNEKLWIGLLGSSIGYLLPNPNLKHNIKLV